MRGERERGRYKNRGIERQRLGARTGAGVTQSRSHTSPEPELVPELELKPAAEQSEYVS